MRLVYAGTPEFAVTILDALVDAGHAIAAVYTQPDRPAGRGRHLRPSAVKQRALELAIPVAQPRTLRSPQTLAELAAHAADAMVVAAYGLLLPQAVLDLPRHGCINVHASLLPRWRGAAPIQRAILAGDTQTGVSIMLMDAGLDTGPVLAQARCPIGAGDTGASLHRSLARLGAETLVQTLEGLDREPAEASAQDDALATLAARIDKAESAIDWRRDAASIERAVRAFDPWPVAYTTLGDGSRLRIWQACVSTATDAPPGTVLAAGHGQLRVACGDAALDLLEVQAAGSRRMPAGEFLNAGRIVPGTRLGDR